MAKKDVIKEHIKGDRLFWFCSMFSVLFFGEMLFYEETGEVLFLILIVLCVVFIISSIYFYRRLQKNIKLLSKL